MGSQSEGGREMKGLAGSVAQRDAESSSHGEPIQRLIYCWDGSRTSVRPGQADCALQVDCTILEASDNDSDSFGPSKANV